MNLGFKLMYQKDLNDEEKEIALKVFHWFIKKAFNPQRYEEEKKELVPIPEVPLPYWKHITRGGHKNGAPLQRGKWGMRLDVWASGKEIGKTLLFRRHGKQERLFVVQRTDTVDVMRSVLPAPDTTGKGCVCNQCMGGRPGRSRLTLNDFKLYATIGDTKG